MKIIAITCLRYRSPRNGVIQWKSRTSQRASWRNNLRRQSWIFLYIRTDQILGAALDYQNKLVLASRLLGSRIIVVNDVPCIHIRSVCDQCNHQGREQNKPLKSLQIHGINSPWGIVEGLSATGRERESLLRVSLILFLFSVQWWSIVVARATKMLLLWTLFLSCFLTHPTRLDLDWLKFG